MPVKIELIYGDCLVEMKKIPKESIDMILCDPPYGHKNNDDDLISRRELALGKKTMVIMQDVL